MSTRNGAIGRPTGSYPETGLEEINMERSPRSRLLARNSFRFARQSGMVRAATVSKIWVLYSSRRNYWTGADDFALGTNREHRRSLVPSSTACDLDHCQAGHTCLLSDV